MTAVATDRLPALPEAQVIEPIAQCGVLYLGTAVPTPGRRGLDSVQEPLSHRYPVDGTNTARGIDAILSIYDNGIQLTFTRHPHVVLFFPLSSLIYCASLRYSIVANDQTSSLDWRFVTLDSPDESSSRHPPLFCAVVQRTQILSGDECHCFITKSAAAALALVRTVSEIYANLPANIKPLRSPIFYQLDRYGRKLTETSGTIYLSPATRDESQLDPANNSVNRQVLLDPCLDGFFYRTDVTAIERWQLWDDDDRTGVRPRPPPSPFGQNQGLYHDDLTDELQQSLRHMDTEERSRSRSGSSSSAEHHHRPRRRKSQTRHRTDPLHTAFSHSQTSAFDPTTLPPQNTRQILKPPIIIEKILPNPLIITRHPSPPLSPPASVQETHDDYAPFPSAYHINEHGEKITREGNRILFMDVIQPNTDTDVQPYKTPRARRQRSKPIPVLDLRSIEHLLRTSSHAPPPRDNAHLSTSDMLEIVEGYFEDNQGRKVKLNGTNAQAVLEHFDASSHTEHPRRSRSRRSQSTVTAGPGVNYVERSASNHSQPAPAANPPDYISPLRYMQSSLNPLVLEEYRNLFNPVQ